jgi:hypothetical protein
MLCLGLAAFAVFALASRKVLLLDRGLEAGDIVVLGVFAAFALLCALIGWRLLGHGAKSEAPVAQPSTEPKPPMRVRLSHVCAAAGVVLLISSVLLPADWHPVVPLFAGLALLAVSHVLTPCVERIEQLRRARASIRQL